MLVCLLWLGLWAPPGFDAAWRLARDPGAEGAAAEAALRPFAVGEGVAAGRAWFALGELAERREAPAEAVAAYRASLAADPGGRFARRAQARLAVLEARPAADAAVLAALDRVQREHLQLGRAAAQAAVAGLLAEAQTGPARAALRLWQAGDALAAGEPAVALALEAAGLPEVPPLVVRRAVELALQGASHAELDAVEAAVARLAVQRPELEAAIDLERLRDEVVDRRQRRAATVAAVAVLGLFALLLALARPWRALRAPLRQRWRPSRGLLFLAWGFGGAGLLAQTYEPGYGLVFALCGVGAAGVFLGVGAGALTAGPRLARALAWWAAPATLAVLFLVLARLGRTALMGM